jgi:transcriptional regulator with XRE-family HTH domain
MQSPIDFAERLRVALARRRRNKAWLAASLGIEEKTAGNWARGQTEPKATDIAAICAVLGVSADYLLGRAEHECGLTSGTHLVDTDAFRQRHDEDGPWRVKIPKNPIIVDDDGLRKLRESIEEKGE